MAVVEYHDGTTWHSLASEEYVAGLFSPVSQYYVNNLTTQSLAANVWAKLGGNITNTISLGVSDLLPSLGTTNRVTKSTFLSGAWYKADATAVLRSSNAFGNPRLSLQIVKNGILSSVLPQSCPIVVDIANVNLGLRIDTSYIQLFTNDYIEIYISSTNATTLTLVDLTFNVMRVR